MAAQVSSLLSLGKPSDHEKLLSLSVNPLDYNFEDRFVFRDDYLAVELLSKSNFLKTTYDLEKVAYETFLQNELQCKLTNDRIEKSTSLSEKEDRELQLLLAECSRKIWLILPSLSVKQFGECLADNAKFGPGSTTQTGGDKTSPYEKVSDLGLTKKAYPFLALVKKCKSWMKVHGGKPIYRWESGSKLLFVPKNAKTHRAICVEPNINTYFQGAVGSMIKQSLSKAGYHIPSLQEKHKTLAKQASLDGCLATLDLKAASDTISYKLVEALLPHLWFEIMDALRCDLTTYKGQNIVLEKFSSMGNSFTFELETLLFLTLCMCLCERKGIWHTPDTLSVYGDDIICPTSIVSDLQYWLPIVGFNLNLKKSFSRGLFRESCGGHFFGGVDVTPLYIKEGVDNGIKSITLQNRIRILAHRRCNGYGCDVRLKEAYDTVEKRSNLYYNSCIPAGPYGAGDGHVYRNWDEVRPKSVIKNGVRFWVFKTIQNRTSRYEAHSSVAYYSYVLYMAGSGVDSEISSSSCEDSDRQIQYVTGCGPLNEFDKKCCVPFRKKTVQKVVKAVSSNWYDLGPWF